jgi:C4-dicarboxylate transporter
MESKDELVFVDFFSFIQCPLQFATNIARKLSKVTKGILVTNVACNLVAKTSQKMCFSDFVKDNDEHFFGMVITNF